MTREVIKRKPVPDGYHGSHSNYRQAPRSKPRNPHPLAPDYEYDFYETYLRYRWPSSEPTPESFDPINLERRLHRELEGDIYQALSPDRSRRAPGESRHVSSSRKRKQKAICPSESDQYWCDPRYSNDGMMIDGYPENSYTGHYYYAPEEEPAEKPRKLRRSRRSQNLDGGSRGSISGKSNKSSGKSSSKHSSKHSSSHRHGSSTHHHHHHHYQQHNHRDSVKTTATRRSPTREAYRHYPEIPPRESSRKKSSSGSSSSGSDKKRWRRGRRQHKQPDETWATAPDQDLPRFGPGSKPPPSKSAYQAIGIGPVRTSRWKLPRYFPFQSRSRW